MKSRPTPSPIHVVDLRTALRDRLIEMECHHRAMQEDIMIIPARRVPVLCAVLEHHASRMSRLAAQLMELEVSL